MKVSKKNVPAIYQGKTRHYVDLTGLVVRRCTGFTASSEIRVSGDSLSIVD